MARTLLLEKLINRLGCLVRTLNTGERYMFGHQYVSSSQVACIFQIAHNPQGLTVKELAERMGVTSGAITQFVNDLVIKRLVVRRQDTTDRRVFHMTLTLHAEKAMQEFKKQYFLHISPLFDTLTNDDMRILLSLLEKIPLKGNNH